MVLLDERNSLVQYLISNRKVCECGTHTVKGPLLGYTLLLTALKKPNLPHVNISVSFLNPC